MQTFKTFEAYSCFKTLIIIISVLNGFQTHAQTKFTDNLNGMLNFHYGYNLPEYPFITSITESPIKSVDFCLFKETAGNNLWEQLYHYPAYGISFFYSTLGNDKVFGREFGLTYFYKVYFITKNHFRLFNRAGIGLSYVNRKFDLKNNYLNVAIASNVNIHFNFGFGADYEISDKLRLTSGLSFDHLSNGNTSEPNLGLNYLTGYGGLIFSLGAKTEKKTHQIETHVKENSFVIFASVGGKHSRALVASYYETSSFSFEFNRSLTRMLHFGLGSDLFYDSSVESSMRKNKQEYQKKYSINTGIHLSQSIAYNNISFAIQEGVYLFFTEHVGNYPIYNRIVLQYQINHHILVRLAMKTHLHILDFPEIGVGYNF